MRHFVSCRVRNLLTGLDAPVTEHGEAVEAETTLAAFTLWICGKSCEKSAWLRCSVEDLKRLLAMEEQELHTEGFEGGEGSMDWETGDFYHSEKVVTMSGTACCCEFEFEVVVLPESTLPAEVTTDAVHKMAYELDETFDTWAIDDAMAPYFEALVEKIADKFDLTHAQFEALEERLGWQWVMLPAKK